MLTIPVWQTIVFVLTLAVCMAALLKGRVTLSKLLFALGLTVFTLLSLARTPLEKRIARLERQVSVGNPDDPAVRALHIQLDAARDLHRTVNNDPNRRLESWLPFTLGLDLQGGTEIRLALRLDPLRLQRLEGELKQLEERREAATDNVARDRLAKEIQFKRDEIGEESRNLDQNLAGAVDIIRRRLNSSGVQEIPVTRQGRDKVLVQLPGMDASQAADALSMIQRQGKLEFRLVMERDSDEVGRYIDMLEQNADTRDRELLNLDLSTMTETPFDQVDDEGYSLATGQPLYDWLRADDSYSRADGMRRGEMLLVAKQVLLGGDAINQAAAEPNAESAGYQVSLTFNSVGAHKFENITSAYRGRRLAIVLDGKLKSAPVLQSVITNGRARITGNFDIQEARALDAVFKSGSMKVKVEEEFRNTVGATLGEDSIRSSLTAMAVGLLVMMIFMAVYYRTAGLVTNTVLILNTLLVAAALAGMDATMTLPGFAGFVLTIGMAVDANVLIFERIREERERGNPLQRALQLGYSRAFVTILDSNLTTLITAIILHRFGSETVRGFAITLIIGVTLSMFCSVVVTRWLFEALIGWGWLKEFRMMRLFGKLNVDFVRLRRPAIGLSAVLIVLGIGLFVWRGERNFGQDFTGGVLANIDTRAHPLTMEEARAVASEKLPQFPDVAGSLQSYGKASEDGRFSEFLLRSQQVELDAAALRTRREKGESVAGAVDFQEAVREAFNLGPDGYTLSRYADGDADDGTAMAFRADLALKDPLSPRGLADVLNGGGFGVLWAGAGGVAPVLADPPALADPTALSEEPGQSLSVVMTLPTRDERGVPIDEEVLLSTVRDKLSALQRDDRLFNFADPFPRFTAVGATVASEMGAQAFMALFFSLVMIFFYIWLRFQFKMVFGVGAVLALAHDVLIALGALALADQLGILNGQIDLTTVAAFLTVVGYSLNDTIVIFDRIRENLRDTGKPLAEVINLSINQTMSRTVITSATTLVVVVALLVLGGEVIRAFAFVLLVGFVAGTYSSIFIASPVLVEFARYRSDRARAKLAAAGPAAGGAGKNLIEQEMEGEELDED